MGAGGAKRGALGRGERKQAVAAVALAGEGVGEISAGAGDDLDLRGDELAGDVLAKQGIAEERQVAELLEAGNEIERGGVEDRELLLQADREVGGERESFNCLVEVQTGQVR